MIPALMLAAVLASPAQSADLPIQIGQRERVAFFGDSISEPGEGSWTLLVESAIRARLPHSQAVFRNRSQRGATVDNGDTRMVKELSAWKPTLIFSCLGMNDAFLTATGYTSATAYANACRRQAAAAKKMGARIVFISPPGFNAEASRLKPTITYSNPGQGKVANPPPRNPDEVNDILAAYTRELVSVGVETGSPVIDLCTPTIAAIRRATHPLLAAALAPDSVHPSPSGNLLIALIVLRRLDLAPLAIGISGSATGPITATGTILSRVRASARGIEFTVRLPIQPMYYPPKARLAPVLFDGEEDFNGFTLSVTGWDSTANIALKVGGKKVASFSGAELAAGIDLNTVDSAPWAIRGRKLLDAVRLGSGHPKWMELVAGFRAPRGEPPQPAGFTGPVSYRITIEPENTVKK